MPLEFYRGFIRLVQAIYQELAKGSGGVARANNLAPLLFEGIPFQNAVLHELVCCLRMSNRNRVNYQYHSVRAPCSAFTMMYHTVPTKLSVAGPVQRLGLNFSSALVLATVST